MSQKRFIYFALFFLTYSYSFANQPVTLVLKKADSLYESGSYREADDLYRKILSESKSYTPAMLLKMTHVARVKENYSEALYYLNLYYHSEPDSEVLTQIVELSEKNKLSGYEQDDFRYLNAFYNRYKIPVNLLILLFFTAGLLYLYRRKLQGKNILYRSLLFVFAAGIYFWAYNFVADYRFAIVKNPKAFLMEAPSAAAEPLKTFEIGNCAEVIGENDIWWEVKVKDKDRTTIGFIRKTSVWLVE